MKLAHTTIPLLASMLISAPLFADDARLQRAIELFEQEKFAESARIFEELNVENPSNTMRLNTMVAWYKAKECPEAMSAWRSVDRDERLEARDLQDLDNVEAYCIWTTAKAEADTGQYDKALATLDSVTSKYSEWHDEIRTLRAEIVAKQNAPADEVAPKEEPIAIAPAPTPAPAAPKWALWTGLGTGSVGVGLVIGGVVKTLVENGQIDEIETEYVAQNGAACSPDRGEGCSAGYSEWWQSEVVPQRTVNTTMIVAGGSLAVVGTGLLVYYAMSGKSPRSAWVPTVGTDGVGAAFHLRF